MSFKFLYNRRINKSQPRQLEIVEFCGNKEFPRVGLQIQFPDALSPFAVICENEVCHSYIVIVQL